MNTKRTFNEAIFWYRLRYVTSVACLIATTVTVNRCINAYSRRTLVQIQDVHVYPSTYMEVRKTLQELINVKIQKTQRDLEEQGKLPTWGQK